MPDVWIKLKYYLYIHHIHQLAIRLGVLCMLLATLPLATDEIVKYTQAPHIFSGIGAIASCVGACVPVLTLFRNSD